jgi:acyl dehydratase
MAATIYWEDMVPGTVRDLGQVKVTAEEIVEFARKYDPQPFHLSESGGQASMFGGLCASGWMTCGLAMRLTVDNYLSHTVSHGSPGLENLKWLKPVFPGDTLVLKHSILEARPLRSRADVGLVRAVWEMFNQDGERVMTMEGYGMFGRRPAATTTGKDA